LEEDTPLYRDYTDGKVDLPSWEENRAMYHAASEALKEAGYHHYEVSNASLPGFECRHNLKYWNMQPYLGFGISAHSFVNGCRGEADYSGSDKDVCGSRPDRSDADRSASGSQGIFGLGPGCESDLKGDFVFTKLRLIDGFRLSDYSGLFGTDFCVDFAAVLPQLLKDGLLEQNGEILRFTQKGLDNTNPVMGSLIEALEKPETVI
ncbi:MAG: hypothetical protein II024_02280, partial [Firmicutes bacterium]|nr:hypothetical protein [Bacillota bacterium]